MNTYVKMSLHYPKVMKLQTCTALFGSLCILLKPIELIIIIISIYLNMLNHILPGDCSLLRLEKVDVIAYTGMYIYT